MIGTGNTSKRKTSELKCSQIKELFSPYLDGAVTGTEMLALQDHLSGCPRCHREYQGLRRTQQLLATVGASEGSGRFGVNCAWRSRARQQWRGRGRLRGACVYAWRMPSKLSWFPRPPGF